MHDPESCEVLSASDSLVEADKKNKSAFVAPSTTKDQKIGIDYVGPQFGCKESSMILYYRGDCDQDSASRRNVERDDWGFDRLSEYVGICGCT